VLTLITLGVFFIGNKYFSEKEYIQVSFETSNENEISKEENAIVQEMEEFKEEDLKFVELENESMDINQPEQEEKEIPRKISINVPFTSQAPYAVWDEYHKEACEEASLLMIKYFLDKKSLTHEISEKEIQKMIKFQIDKYGKYKDTNAKETVELAKDLYGIDNLEIIYDFKKEDIKNELAKGSPIIVPAAGQLLGNPYFTPPGPLYHNLVLVGYEESVIITNDPGTKRGEGYRYDMNVLYSAIHDFPGKKEDIEKGRKAMIVIKDE